MTQQACDDLDEPQFGPVAPGFEEQRLLSYGRGRGREDSDVQRELADQQVRKSARQVEHLRACPQSRDGNPAECRREAMSASNQPLYSRADAGI